MWWKHYVRVRYVQHLRTADYKRRLCVVFTKYKRDRHLNEVHEHMCRGFVVIYYKNLHKSKCLFTNLNLIMQIKMETSSQRNTLLTTLCFVRFHIIFSKLLSYNYMNRLLQTLRENVQRNLTHAFRQNGLRSKLMDM